MELPDVPNVARLPNGVTVTVMAYRRMTQEELLLAVRHLEAGLPRKRFKKNTDYRVSYLAE